MQQEVPQAQAPSQRKPLMSFASSSRGMPDQVSFLHLAKVPEIVLSCFPRSKLHKAKSFPASQALYVGQMHADVLGEMVYALLKSAEALRDFLTGTECVGSEKVASRRYAKLQFWQHSSACRPLRPCRHWATNERPPNKPPSTTRPQASIACKHLCFNIDM